MAVAFGLLAALFWGLADFLISLAGRRFGVVHSMLLAQATGLFWVAAWLLCITDGVPDVTVSCWLLAIAAAALGFMATLALYLGLQVGAVAIAAPIAASFGAVTTLLTIAGGNVPDAAMLCGLCLILAGVLLTGARPEHDATSDTRRGVLYASLAAIGFGAQFWLQGRFVIPQMGSLWSVATTYLFSTALLTTVVLKRQCHASLSWKAGLTAFATGSVAVAGFLSISLGLATGQLAIVTVLSSLQSVVTVFIAVVFYGEKPVRRQWAGLVLLLCGLVLTRLR